MIPMYGSFKGERGVKRCFIMRIACRTRSGFDIRPWVARVLKHEKHSNTQYLFANSKGRKEKAGLYEPYFFDKLEAVQEQEDGLIGRRVNVREVYGTSRSFRRGATTVATNAPNEWCDANDIERNNRWRKEDKAGTKQASLNMIQLYTDTLQSLQADLRFSRCM